MPRLIIILVAGFLLYLVFQYAKRLPKSQQKIYLSWALIVAAVLILLLLAVTGKLSWLAAVVTTIIAAIPRIMRMGSKLWPFIMQFQSLRNKQQKHHYQADARQKSAQAKSGMSKQEACEVLGIGLDADKKSVIKAHKRMIQKLHPDRGGSDYLAAKINEARDVLLS